MASAHRLPAHDGCIPSFANDRVRVSGSAHTITIIILSIIIIILLYYSWMYFRRHAFVVYFSRLIFRTQAKRKIKKNEGTQENDGCCATKKTHRQKKPNYVYFALCETSKWNKNKVK